MVARTASLDPMDPDAAEFVRFCYRRRRVGWPELYDEMCAVAARGHYRGMVADDLAGLGIGLSLFDMPALAALASRVIAEEQAKRRPVAVAIVADATEAVVAETAATEVAGVPPVAMSRTPDVHETRDERPAERVLDVPIRLATAPAGA